MNTFEIFQTRSKEKKKSAIWMLCVGVAVIVTGFFIFFNQLSTINETYSKSLERIASATQIPQTEREELLHSLDTNQILNMVSRIGLLIIVFFLAQIFLRLYKYHLNMSDFYLSCCDAINLNEEIDPPKKKESYISLLQALYPQSNKLDIPKDPNVESIVKSIKE